MTVRIATWNVNSIKVRLGAVRDWLRETNPDVLLLQEIKCETGSFPTEAFAEEGYHGPVLGQKTYNGVALLAREPVSDVLERLPGDTEDAQARYLEGTVGGVRIACLYLPNGNPAGTDKYRYKLAWMERLRRRAAVLLEEGLPVVLGGDFNVIPTADDVYDPVGWTDDALFRLETRAAYRAVVHMGFTDALRAVRPVGTRGHPIYTFWDYQAGRWARDEGLRIDHFLLSARAADRLSDCIVDRSPRGREKASDHTPVMLELAS